MGVLYRLIKKGKEMDLKLKEVAKLLKVSEKTIYRWIKDEKIPYYRINHQYRFRTDEINQWAVNNKYDISETDIETYSNNPVSISSSLKNGGIYYHITGNDMPTTLSDAVNLINIPHGLNRSTILTNLIRREEMAPTAMGNGIAFPHPRTPIVTDITSESLSICFLDTPLEGYALDNIPIHTILIILSATQTRHLQLISKLSFLCRQEKFIELLRTRALREDILSYIAQLFK